MNFDLGTLERAISAQANHNPIVGAEGILQQLASVFFPDRIAAAPAVYEMPGVETRYRILIEQIPAVVFMAFLDQGVSEAYVSPQIETLLGYSQAEWLQDPIRWYQRIHPADRGRWNIEGAEMLLTGKPLRSVYRVLARDDRVVWFHCEVRMVRRPDGRPWFIHGVGFDITELKSAEAELQRAHDELETRVRERTAEMQHTNAALQIEIAERQQAEENRRQLEAQLQQAQKMEAIGTLAGGIAHDFNNILGAIIGNAELALTTVGDNASSQQNLATILKASHRAANLVRQILAFSRQQEQEYQPIKLASVIKESLQLLRATIPATIEICADFASDEISILADATQIHQVMMNLGTNAAHAMAERGGRLDIRLATLEVDASLPPDLPEGRYVRLSISDQGKGMTPATMERIFEPFFTTKAPGEGTGLGLAVVHGIVKSHRGAITVESQVEAGTTFHLYFPLHLSQVHEPKAVLPAVAQALRHGECILFVDDEEMLVRLGKEMLQPLGYEVIVHTNPVESLADFQTRPEHFDLVITDLAMAGMSGIELARRLLQIRPSLPIILTTGNQGELDAEKARQMGFRMLLVKPYTLDSLGEAVYRVLMQSHEVLPYA